MVEATPWSQQIPLPGCVGRMRRVLMRNDNACLFRSVDFLLHHSSKGPDYYRQIVQREIEKDSITFSDAILGKPRHEYIEWIGQPDSWGGYLELVILSNYYKIQFAVVTIDTSKLYIYGDTFSERAYMSYDGSHYDCIVAEHSSAGCSDHDGNNPSREVEFGIFRVEDQTTERKALQMADTFQNEEWPPNLPDEQGCVSSCNQIFPGKSTLEDQ